MRPPQRPAALLLAALALACCGCDAFKGRGHSMPTTTHLQLYEIKDPEAVCNDGTACARPAARLRRRACARARPAAAVRPPQLPHALIARVPCAAGFYYAPANDTAKSNLWLVYLEGGQWCAPRGACGAAPRAAPHLRASHSPARRRIPPAPQVLQRAHVHAARLGHGAADVIAQLGQGHPAGGHL
jgi:hypothetical protein